MYLIFPMKFSKELMKGSTQQLILAVLKRKDLYGYEIIKEIARQSEEILTLGEGSIYPMLHQLEGKNFIKSYWQNEGGRDRKYYTITRKGKTVFINHLKEWKLFSTSLNKIFQLT
jgi:PadR family transcriptional regulator PadR